MAQLPQNTKPGVGAGTSDPLDLIACQTTSDPRPAVTAAADINLRIWTRSQSSSSAPEVAEQVLPH